VVAPRDFERIELERAEAVHDAHHGRRLGRQRARRGEQMAQDEEAARGGRTDDTGLVAHETRW
jgi:hypothetical protein